MSQVNSREIAGARSEVLKGLAAGAIGGLVASWVMDEFQSAWFKLSKRIEQSEAGESASANNGEQSQNGAAEPATVKAAALIAETIFGHRLAKDEKKLAGDAVHYATGT